MLRPKKASGFTIVELLVVIVVIAILAAITIVAYNGIQERARNTRTVAAAEQAIKLLGAYKAINGAYPTSGLLYACIGEYAADVCQYASPGVPEVQEQTAFKTAIATVGSMPQPTDQLYAGGGLRTSGGAYYRTDLMRVTYYLSGNNKSCDAGGTASNIGAVTQCAYDLP
jgi:general secretion pathway protein G